MNERIEHITKQVDEYFDDLSIKFSRQAWMEKFAELLVKECMRLNSKELSITAIERLLPLYKEHFGVEE